MGENEIWSSLKLEYYFQDILDSDQLLDAIYVEDIGGKEGPVEEYEQIINRAYPQVLKTEGLHTSDGTVETAKSKLDGSHDCAYLVEFINGAYMQGSQTMHIRRTRASKRLLVILGGIGEGKTSLLWYFFRRYTRKKHDLLNIVWLNIDFEGMEGIKPEQLTADYLSVHILKEVDRQFPELRKDKNKLFAVLKEPLSVQKGLLDVIEERAGIDVRDEEELDLIKRFSKNNMILLTSMINYLVKAEGKKVVVTLDNVDRLNSECQYQAITLLHEALHQWDCCAIVCVREYTYGNLWLMGQWGFQRPLLYHKRPPRFATVLQRRFRQLPIQDYIESPTFNIRGKVIEVKDVKRFIGNVANFLCTKDMEDALFRLNNGDTRQMLEMVRAFLSFHALDLEQLYTATFLKDRAEATKIRGLTHNFDNFIRAITVGNYQYYCVSNPLMPSARETFVLNMVGGPQNAPLLPYRVLTYIRKFEIVNKGPLIEKATCMGVSKQDVENVLEAFLKSYLIESMQGIDIRDVKEVVITRKGVYFFDILATLAVYIENVMNDAWWDEKVEPYEQSYTLRKECEFLEKILKYIFRTEVREAEGVPERSRAGYHEFLDKKPYCERLGESIFSHLKSLESRGTKIPNGILDSFEKQLEEIYKAKEGGQLAYVSSSKQ